MRFATINESREWSDAAPVSKVAPRIVQREEVEREARRRKACLGLDKWNLREFVYGTPMPAHVSALCEEIERAAMALSRMSPIPTNFDDDVYWPPVW